MPENEVTISNREYAELVAAFNELEAVKRLLRNRVVRYCGLPQTELETVCVMLGIERTEDDCE